MEELSPLPWLWFWRDRNRRKRRKESGNDPLKYRLCVLTPSLGWLCHVLMAMVQSVIRRVPNSLCPSWKNP
jgi:hypothetical protein